MELIEKDLTHDQLELASKMVMQKFNFLYRKLEPNKYETLCTTCRRKNIITYKQLREIQHSHHCPDCNKWMHHTTQKTKGDLIDYVDVDNLGYCIDISYDFDKIWVNSYEQFADFNYYGRRSTAIKRGYNLNTSGCIYKRTWANDGTWKYNYNFKYRNYCYSYNSSLFTMLNGSPAERRIIYKKECGFLTKSNQIKLVIDNRLTHQQAKLVKVFDLNNIDDVNKYKYLLNDSRFIIHLEDYIRYNMILNIHYLEYFARTGIDLGKYYHYANNLKLLGWKLDKPRTIDDFEYRLNKTDDMIQAEKDKVLNDSIERRYNSLPKYQKGNVSISPFRNAKDIRDSGKKLHNCIGGYVEKYAQQMTDLYHLDVDDDLLIDIEVCGNSLIQARGDHNSKCPVELMTHITEFCTLNNISL